MDRIIKRLLLVLVQVAAVAVDASSIAKPGCQDECGIVKIPYPFGIGDGCFYTRTDLASYFYNITCNETTNPPTPIYRSTIPISNTALNSPILNINLDDHSFRLNTLVAFDCYQNNQSVMHFNSVLGVMGFTVNTTRNKFVGIGCDTKATFQGYRFSKDVYYYSTGCISYCNSMDFIENGTCTGFGCCEISVPYGANYVSSDVFSYFNHSNSAFNPCSTAFVVEDGAFNFSTLNLTYKADYYTQGHIRVPVVVDWSILNATCNQTTGQDQVICGSNTQCIDGVYANLTNSYRCKCSSGYSGNPYLPHGCQDIDECSDPALNDCQKREYCVNTEGGYHCKCPSGYHGSATNADKGVHS